MSDEQQRIGIMHAGFAMTALPHKAINETIWVRQGNNIKLRLESGMDADNKVVGLPFGAIARIILLYLQTEAVKTKSRDIELGRSMNHWLTTMGIDNGGKTYKLVREQSRRLSLCRLLPSDRRSHDHHQRQLRSRRHPAQPRHRSAPVLA
jgi:hypothetical protein